MRPRKAKKLRDRVIDLQREVHASKDGDPRAKEVVDGLSRARRGLERMWTE